MEGRHAKYDSVYPCHRIGGLDLCQTSSMMDAEGSGEERQVGRWEGGGGPSALI